MILKYTELNKLRKKWADKTIVCGGGSFDILHLGHIDFLKTLKKHGDKVVVLINSDKRIKTKKGKLRPINNELERANIIDSIKYVDAVVICPNISNATENCLKKLKPDKFLCIYKNRWKNKDTFFKDNNIKYKYIDPKKTRSTTKIINKILKAYIHKED